jgi:hypothetical protein
MTNRSLGGLRSGIQKRLPLVTLLLAVALIVMFILFLWQWFIVQAVFKFVADVVVEHLIQQAPDGVDNAEIRKTLGRVRQAMIGMPITIIIGKINLRKVKAAADYALKANEDEEWTSDEVETLLAMMNAAVGFKKE